MGKILGIALSLYACVAFAQEITQNPDGSVTITVSKEEVEQCKANGGCMLVPMKMIEAGLFVKPRS